MRKITLNFLVVFMLISCFEIRSTVALRVVRLRANSCTVVLSSKFRRRSGSAAAGRQRGSPGAA